MGERCGNVRVRWVEKDKEIEVECENMSSTVNETLDDLRVGKVWRKTVPRIVIITHAVISATHSK